MSTTIQMTGALDPRDGWVAEHCPMAAALDIVRNRSAFLILREAFYGATRFEEFAERTQLSEPVTAARLHELADEGLLEREPYREPGQRTRQAYRLTEKGADLLPVVVSLMQWGQRWAQTGTNRSRVEIRHRDCGAPVTAQLRCGHDHPVAADELELATRRRAAD